MTLLSDEERESSVAAFLLTDTHGAHPLVIFPPLISHLLSLFVLILLTITDSIFVHFYANFFKIISKSDFLTNKKPDSYEITILSSCFAFSIRTLTYC